VRRGLRLTTDSKPRGVRWICSVSVARSPHRQPAGLRALCIRSFGNFTSVVAVALACDGLLGPPCYAVQDTNGHEHVSDRSAARQHHRRQWRRGVCARSCGVADWSDAATRGADICVYYSRRVPALWAGHYLGPSGEEDISCEGSPSEFYRSTSAAVATSRQHVRVCLCVDPLCRVRDYWRQDRTGDYPRAARGFGVRGRFLSDVHGGLYRGAQRSDVGRAEGPSA
jgi:hypothetical protein